MTSVSWSKDSFISMCNTEVKKNSTQNFLYRLVVLVKSMEYFLACYLLLPLWTCEYNMSFLPKGVSLSRNKEKLTLSCTCNPESQQYPELHKTRVDFRVREVIVPICSALLRPLRPGMGHPAWESCGTSAAEESHKSIRRLKDLSYKQSLTGLGFF